MGWKVNDMKKTIIALVSVAALAQVPDDAITVSTSTRTVTEVKTKEWRRFVFDADPASGEITVSAMYEEVIRVDGKPTTFKELRSVRLPWAQATNISPSLVLVREELKSAMPTILTNAP